jgi:hypothetical protein
MIKTVIHSRLQSFDKLRMLRRRPRSISLQETASFSLRSFIFLLLASFMLLNIAGCWFIVGGAAGAAGAYAASKDTIQGETDKPYDGLWSASRAVARIRGAIKSENYGTGVIELEADASQVWIRVIRMTHATTRVRISARKHHLPNISLAQELYTKIMEEVK